MQVLLDGNKNFYKANLHCHSKNSDGKMSVEELKEEYKKRGYSIVAFTDHEHVIDNSHIDDDDFLTITSCEIAIKENARESTMKNYGMRVCHLNLYALDRHNTVTPCYNSVADHFKNPEIEPFIKHTGEYERVYSADGINDIIKKARDMGFIVAYNHPLWSLEDARQYLGYEGLFAVEIYNHANAVGGGNDYCPSVFDDFLRDGKHIFCTMCDDCHQRHGSEGNDSDMFGGFVMINAERLDYKTVMTSLEEGQFYASQGPLIKCLVRDGNRVIIETSPAVRIALSTAGRRAEALNASKGEEICRAEFKVRNADRYFRITVTDQYGRHAHTQGYEI